MSASTYVITITASQVSGQWEIQVPAETTATSGDTVQFELGGVGGGTFFFVTFPPDQTVIFENANGNPWFFGTSAQPTAGGTVTNTGTGPIEANFHVFWTNGSAKARIDPKVIVKPGTGNS